MDWQPAREKREIWVTISGATLAMLLATAIIVARVAALPLMPIDETRYLSVAWEMWQHHTFLVPTLNGEAYSHKPPLLFWLIQLGWWLFGTSDWVARLVIPPWGYPPSGSWPISCVSSTPTPDGRPGGRPWCCWALPSGSSFCP